jgi:hypothetical protein
MSVSKPFFDSGAVRWREVTGELFSRVHHVRHDYTILAHDAAAGTLDMLVRWRSDGGHCPLHRHTAATTSVFVLEGEQHVQDILPDGTLAPVKVRRAGDYALLPKDALAHLEGGGPNGGLAFFGCHTPDGRLYEIVDDDGQLLVDITVDYLLADFAAAATDV